MTLTFLTYSRRESDPTIIATLQRKGWILNNPPSYDPATQHEPSWNGSQWIVAPLSQSELDAIAASAQDTQERNIAKAFRAALLAGNGTNLERIARLEKCAAYLIKNL